MKLNILFFNFISCLLASASFAGEYLIQDPLKDVLTNREHSKGTFILQFEADINNDGKKDLFIADTEMSFSAAGFLWNVYVRKNGVYEAVSGLSFHPKAVFIGFFEPVKKNVLVTYERGGGVSGILLAYEFKNNEFKEIWSKEIRPGENEQDQKFYQSIFGESENPKQPVDMKPIEELAGKYEVTLKEKSTILKINEPQKNNRDNAPVPNSDTSDKGPQPIRQTHDASTQGILKTPDSWIPVKVIIIVSAIAAILAMFIFRSTKKGC